MSRVSTLLVCASAAVGLALGGCANAPQMGSMSQSTQNAVTGAGVGAAAGALLGAATAAGNSGQSAMQGAILGGVLGAIGGKLFGPQSANTQAQPAQQSQPGYAQQPSYAPSYAVPAQRPAYSTSTYQTYVPR